MQYATENQVGTKAVRIGQVQEHLRGLTGEIEACLKAVEELESKLQPVLLNEPPAATGLLQKEDANGRVPIAETIHGIGSKASHLLQRITGIIGRIEV